MKLLHAKTINSTVAHESRKCRRYDLISPLTGELPENICDGPLDEVVSVAIYNGTETLEIEDAATDMNDLDELTHNGRRYQIVEAAQSNQYGFWDRIKCIRPLTWGI